VAQPVNQGIHPTAYPLLELARGAVHGHRMIAEKVREHAQRAADDLALRRAAGGAARAAAALPPGGGTGDPAADSGPHSA
jgi:hypothetical protein